MLAVRNAEKGTEAARAIREAVPSAQIEVGSLDLSSLASVRAFAEWLAGEHEDLDLVINNAGTMAFSPLRETADGFEISFGTNHLGQFALTGLLLGRMQGRKDARVVTISGAFHRIGRINFDDMQSEHGYSRMRAYAQSKLANLLFAFELDRRLRAGGSTVRSLAAHPGRDEHPVRGGFVEIRPSVRRYRQTLLRPERRDGGATHPVRRHLPRP